MIRLTVLKVIPEHLVINPLQISLNNFSSGDTLTLVSTPNRGQFLCSCPWLFNQTWPLHWTPYSRQNRFEITFVAIVGIMSNRSVIFELISLSFGIEWMIISSAACKKSDRNFCLRSFKKSESSTELCLWAVRVRIRESWDRDWTFRLLWKLSWVLRAATDCLQENRCD